jgi:hypothetical protein
VSPRHHTPLRKRVTGSFDKRGVRLEDKPHVVLV